MGRERKPLDQHELSGTRPHYTEPESQVESSTPWIPKEFKTRPTERKLFKDYRRALLKRRTCTEGDAELIRLAVICRVRHSRAIEHIETEGEICTYQRLDSNGQSIDVVKPNLWLKVAQDAEKTMVGILDRLGLTPTNRNKVKPTEHKRDKETDTTCSREAALASAAAVPKDEPEITLDDIDLDTIEI
jgi:phage terminase small subunit